MCVAGWLIEGRRVSIQLLYSAYAFARWNVEQHGVGQSRNAQSVSSQSAINLQNVPDQMSSCMSEILRELCSVTNSLNPSHYDARNTCILMSRL